MSQIHWNKPNITRNLFGEYIESYMPYRQNEYFLFQYKIEDVSAESFFGQGSGVDSLFQTWSYTVVEDPDSGLIRADTLANVKLGEPGQIKIQSVITDLNCFESDDGSLNIELLGGTSPYNIFLEDDFGLVHEQFNINQAVSVLIDNLRSGPYLISVLDFNNCSTDSTFIVNLFE